MIRFRDVPVLARTIGQPRRTRASVENFRDARVREIVTHAYRNVPFYRKLYDEHGVDVSRVHGYADLPLLPIVTRQDLQNAKPEDLVAAGVGISRLRINTTNGTTASPLLVRRTFDETRIYQLYFFQAFRSFGVKRRDLAAEICFFSQKSAPPFRRGRQVADALRFYPREKVEISDLGRAADRILELRPAALGGWPSQLSLLATAWQTKGYSNRPGPRFIQTGGERLDRSVRTQLEETFHAPVRDMYSSWELELMAWQCVKTDAYHVSDETVALEVVADGRDLSEGETGMAVGTALHSFASPFIRYAQGDMITVGKPLCDCGAPLSTVLSIDGRTREYFAGPDGRLVGATRIAIEITTAANWVRQSQIVRVGDAALVIRLLPARAPAADEMERLQRAIQNYVGPSFSLELKIVGDLTGQAGAKFKVLVDARENPSHFDFDRQQP
jgi:phenylacetate-CoA ligase